MQIVTNRQFISPAAANSPSVNASGTAWLNSTATEIAPSTTTVCALTGINLSSIADNSPTGFTTDFEVDILVGAALATVLTTICGRYTPPGVALASQAYRLKIPILGLDGRHGFQIRTSNTRTDAYRCAIKYFKTPINGTLFTTSQPQKVSSPSAVPVTLTSGGSAWQNGAWSTLIATTAADLVLTDGCFPHISSSFQGEVDIATRLSGVITMRTMHRLAGSGSPGFMFIYEFANPLDGIPAGVEVIARLRASSGSATCGAKLIYHEKPL